MSIYNASGATIGIFTEAITKKYDASSVPTAMTPLDICHKAMNRPFLKDVFPLGIDGTNLARIEAESGAWLETWERTVNIYGSEQQVKNAMEMINAVPAGFGLPETIFSMEEMDAFFEKYNEDPAAWEDEMKYGWEDIREMLLVYQKLDSSEVTLLKYSADTKNEEVEGKKSVEEGEQEERAESGSGTQNNVEEYKDKRSVNEDEQKECVESESGTQKNVEESEDKKSVKEDEQKECVDTGSGTHKEC